MRDNNPDIYIRDMINALESNELLSFLGCKKYKLFPLEGLDKCLDFLKSNNILPYEAEMKHENKTNNRSYGILQENLLQEIVREFPESMLLWKHSIKNL